jgi:hypothetical protein
MIPKTHDSSPEKNTLEMARPEGLEPPTTWFEAKYSNPTELRARGGRILLIQIKNAKLFSG